MKIQRHSRALILVCFLWAVASCHHEQTSSEVFTGAWVMQLGDRNFIVLELRDEKGTFSGTLSRPADFQTSNGIVFSSIGGGISREIVVGATVTDDHLLFSTENPDEREEGRSEWEMTLTGQDRASIRVLGVPLEAWSFTRSAEKSPPTVASDWDPRAAYSSEAKTISNAEMKRIFEADQVARQNPGSISEERWAVINREDAQRRQRTYELLAEDKLHTSEDFIRAAFVFQHGETSNDLLLAHTLAMIAAAKGDESASWIGAATLDRYLHSIGRPQIYGTQFKPDSDGIATQDPFDQEVIVDFLRRKLGVPTLEVQHEQIDWWTEQLRASSANSE